MCYNPLSIAVGVSRKVGMPHFSCYRAAWLDVRFGVGVAAVESEELVLTNKAVSMAHAGVRNRLAARE